MLLKRNKKRKRIKFQFRGIRLLSPQKKPEPEEKICGVDISELSEFGQRTSHRIEVLEETQ